MGVLTRKEFDFTNFYYRYCWEMLRSLSRTSYGYHSDYRGTFLSSLGHAILLDRELKIDFENHPTQFLPYWYLNSLTPFVYSEKFDEESEERTYFSNALEMACHECFGFQQEYQLWDGNENIQLLLEEFDLTFHDSLDAFLANPEESVLDPRLDEQIAQYIANQIQGWLVNRSLVDKPEIENLKCMLDVEYSKFLCDHIEFSRDIVKSIYPVGFYDETITPPMSSAVTIREIAHYVHLAPKSMTTYTKDWPKPTLEATGRRAARYSYQELLPVLGQQFPTIDWPDDPNELRRVPGR